MNEYLHKKLIGGDLGFDWKNLYSLGKDLLSINISFVMRLVLLYFELVCAHFVHIKKKPPTKLIVSG